MCVCVIECCIVQFVSFNSHFIFNGYIIWPPTSRYVADATPFSLRTAASAAFAMATALGAALGPGMAILLNRMDEFEFHLPFLEQQYFNGMTAPGYFMALSWFIYTLCILFFFGEPTRSGLDELRKREEATIGGSGLATIESDSKKESLLNEVELAAISTENKVDGYVEMESSQDDALEKQDSMMLDEESFNDDDDNVSVTDGSLTDVDASKDDKGYSYHY